VTKHQNDNQTRETTLLYNTTKGVLLTVVGHGSVLTYWRPYSLRKTLYLDKGEDGSTGREGKEETGKKRRGEAVLPIFQNVAVPLDRQLKHLWDVIAPNIVKCLEIIRRPVVVAMHIQVSEAMFGALTASELGYAMRLRGEVEIKVRHKRE